MSINNIIPTKSKKIIKKESIEEVIIPTKSKKIIKKESNNTDIISTNDNNKLRMIDLCAGTGAISYAFQSTGKVDVIYANDMEESSKKIYDSNFNHKLTLGNICNIDIEKIPPHNILTAGFPCQPFSIAGKREGFEDSRSNVFWKILNIIKYHKPEYVVLENVKNLTTHDNGNTFSTIITSLENENYNVIYKILNTSDITDIPQHRERIYIVCIKDKKVFDNFNLNFSKEKKKEINQLLINENIDNKYYYNIESNKIHKMVMDSVINRNTVYQFRRIYVRENKNNECPTLTANMGTGGHNVPIILDNKGARKLTPRECFNFQGFPSNYILPNLSDAKLYKLAGNAVSIPVIQLIANKLIIN